MRFEIFGYTSNNLRETKNSENKFKISNLVQEGNLLSRNLKAVQKDFLNLIGDISELTDGGSGGGGGGTSGTARAL